MRILICESDDLLLDLLKAAVLESGHEVCGTTERAKDALLLASELRPDSAIVNPLLDDGDSSAGLVHDLARLGVPSVLIAKSVDAAPAPTAIRAILHLPFDLEDLVYALAQLNRPGD